MPRLKLIYIASLILLGLVAALTIFKPLATGTHYTELQRESLLKNDREWVLQFDLINRDDSATTYLIKVDRDGRVYNDQVTLAAQREYTYIQHLPRREGADRNLDVAIYSQGRGQPVETLHYNLQ